MEGLKLRTRSLLLAVVAIPCMLAAQQPDSAWKHGMPGGEGMRGGMGMGGGMMGGVMGHMMEHMAPMMGPMMRVMIFSPGHLLMHKEQLNLTEAQVTKLTSLRDGARSAEEAASSEAEKHGHELAEVMGGASADTTALKAHFQAMHAAMGKAHWIG